MEPIDCRKCRHYYITWDKGFPYGCKAMKFKCAGLPAQEVFASSGFPCQFFVRKEEREARTGDKGRDQGG
jgi:hypothetical protein